MSARKVLVVDDDPLFLKLISKVLGREAMTADSLNYGLELAREYRPQIVVLDQWFGRAWSEGRTGIDAIADFMTASPNCFVVVVSSEYYRCLQYKAMGAGAVAYIMKNHDAIQRVVNACRELATSSP